MPPPTRQAPKPATPPKMESKQWRKWRGANVTDARTAIGDDEFAWLENALTVGDGAVQILPHEGDSIARVVNGIATMWGVTLNNAPVHICICMDGSIQQVAVPSGTITQVAAPGSITIGAHVTTWQGSPVLFIDLTRGYSSWDGTTYTVLDATLKGQAIAVNKGRVWIGFAGTLIYSAPDSFVDFTAGSGGGSTVITDEVFKGNIVALVSALDQLWVVGPSAINAIANVIAVGDPPNVTTSFSNTNIVANVGSSLPASVIGYFRALVFASSFGAYALSGVTPQKISEKLDDLPLGGVIGPVRDVPAAVAVVRNLLAVIFLVPYRGRQSVGGVPPVPLLVGFVQGKWFFGYQGALRWITSLVVSGLPEAWGTDGLRVYKLFGADLTTPVSYKVVSKLYDFGNAVQMKQLMKLGIEWRPTPDESTSAFFPESPDVLATGLTETPVTELALSEDGGATWDASANNPSAGAVAWAIEYMGSDIVLLGIENAGDGTVTPTVFRSIDRGVTWDGGQTLPGLTAGATVALYVIRRIGAAGVALAGGISSAAIGPVLWRTVNAGVTWARVDPADIVNTSATSTVYKIRDILDLGDGVVVIGLGGPSGGSNVQWRLSTDSGATFPIETTLVTANPSDVPPAPWQMAITDDGHIISTGDRDAAGNNGVWRGVRVPVTGTPTDIEWSRVLTTAL